MRRSQEAVLLPEFDPEELKQVSRLLAESFAQAHSSQASVLQKTVTEAYASHDKWYACLSEREVIETIRLDLIASSTAGIFDPLGQLRSWLESAFNSVGNWIISTLRSSISGIDSSIRSAISGIVSSVSSAVSSIVNSAMSGLNSLVSGVSSYLTGTILPAINGIVSSISSYMVSNVIPAINSVLSSISNIISQNVLPAISGLGSSISSLISGSVLPAIVGVSTTISALITQSILPALTSIVTTFSDLIVGTVLPAITGSITTISNVLTTNFLPVITSGLTSVVDFMGSHVVPAFGNAISTLTGFLDTYVVKPMYAIATIVSTGFTQLSTITMGFINAILQFPQWFPTWFYQCIGKPVYDALSKLGEWIWGAVPVWLKDALLSIPKFFDNVWQGLQAFIKDPLGWIDQNLWTPFIQGIQAIGDWIWQAIPDWVKTGFESIGTFFNDIWQGLVTFVADPLGTIRPYIDNMWKGLQWIGSKVWDGILFFGDLINKGAKALWNSLRGTFEWIAETVVNFGGWMVQTIFSPLMDMIAGFSAKALEITTKAFTTFLNVASSSAGAIGTTITNIVKPLFLPMCTMIATEVEKPFLDLTKKLYEGKESSGQYAELLTLASLYTGAIFGSQFICRGIAISLHGIATHCEKINWGIKTGWQIDGKGKIYPMGVGGELVAKGKHIVPFMMEINLGKTLRHIAKQIQTYPDELGRSLLYGMGIWMSQPLSMLAKSIFRDQLVLELPPVDMLTDTLRRYMSREDFDEVWESSRGFLRLYGYRTEIIEWLTSKDISLTVTDRFDQSREIPLSQMYELPSASDVATMMVRDIFASIEDFQKLYKARGMTEDIGVLYYFLRFRYPPPERLWQFTTRGISGLLWATASQEELADIKKEAEPLGALLPKSPADLNFQAKPLMNAFKTYMKWHDYARFSWVKDFPSDNLIYIDTLAEIPTKIDQRWMVKWGIYELLASKKVDLKSPISTFRTEVVDSEATSGITMDLTLFSRTLQATGMHPDWIPLTATAEAMNVLTEERTALRTGTVNLFKEGFWDTESLETLLAGAIITSFKISYFDMSTLEWGTGWVNQPVMFLPAERKLVELKALMDRAFDILRETQRDVSTGYQEWIISTYDEFKTKLTKIIVYINEFFSKDYKSITGSDLPNELQLKFVEDYYKPYVESLAIWRDVFTTRRIRSWTQRWLGYIMYRVTTGVVRKEDVESIATYVGEQAKLTPSETSFIQGMLDRMVGISVREYAPTPSQLATLSEYVVISSATVNRVLDARFLPEEWKSIWTQYIDARPIADDVKSLISAYRRAMLYAVIPDTVKNQVLAFAQLIGFTDREFTILALRNQLEEIILDARESKNEYIPTMSMLASMSEIVPRARDFFDQVVVAKHIPSAWVSVWADYVDYRPIVGEINKMVSRAEQLYTYFMVSEADYKAVLDQVAFIGYTPKEIEYMLSNARLQRHYRAWSELIGDVDKMTTLAEYSPKARDYALGQLYKMIDALPVADDTKNILKEMWEQFIRLKPVKDEVTKYVTELVTFYQDGLLSALDFSNELESLKEWGLDDYEIMFYQAIGSMRKARKLKIKIS